MKIFTVIILLCCLLNHNTLVNCDLNSQCQVCFNTANSYKYCMLTMDSEAGKCCLSGSNDDCLLDQFYCSNRVSTSYQYHKYAFCSFNPVKCGNNQRNIKALEVTQTIYTGIEFQNNDVCPYILVSDTNLPFNTNVKVTVETSINTDVYILTGSSIDQIKSQQRLQSGDSVTFDAGQIAIIIVRGTYENAYAQFSYKNVQKLSNAAWIGIIIGSSFGYFLLLMIVLIYITRKLTLKRLRELQSPNIVYYIKKKVIQYIKNKNVPQEERPILYTKMPQVGVQKIQKKLNEINALNEELHNFDVTNDNHGRLETVENKIISSRTGLSLNAPSSALTGVGIRSNVNVTSLNKPKVEIKPYKFNFD